MSNQLNKEEIKQMEEAAANYAKEVWGSDELPFHFTLTRKGKRSYEDFIAGYKYGIQKKSEVDSVEFAEWVEERYLRPKDINLWWEFSKFPDRKSTDAYTTRQLYELFKSK